MKKLLGGIFQKPKDGATPPTSTPTQGAALSPQNKPTGKTPATGSHGARRAMSPPTHDNVYRNGPRSSWDTFFSSPSSAKGPMSPPPPAAANASSVPVPAKVFNQNLEMLMREIAAKIKLVIAKMIEDVAFQTEFAQLCGFINLAADKLLEKGDPSLVLLKNYFASPAGSSLCEQTAFPSLVLDFVNKVRVYLIRNELKKLEDAGVVEAQNASPSSSQPAAHSSTSAEELKRPIHFLMSCVQAIASNVALMEQFRCELPNVIYLIAEDYPASAVYLRDMSSQVLASISDKNFNAGLVWYLNDSSIIGRTVRMMARYGEAERATPATAATALVALTSTTTSPIADPRSSMKEPIAAAVSDALGLNRDVGVSAIETRETAAVAASDEGSEHQQPSEDESAVNYRLVSAYDPAPAFKSLVYTLQKTCRFSLVLLGEFQSSGGYDLLSDSIKSASDEEVSTLIYLFTLLLPLGTGFSGVCGDDDNMATVNTCGARNVGAFLAMRDLVLECMSQFKASTVGDASRARLEQLLLQLLTTILQIYTSSYDNFLCLEQKTQALAMILSKLPCISFFDARVITLRIVEYVCVAAKPDALLPIEILAVLCSQFIEFSTAEALELIEGVGNATEESRSVSSRNDSESPALLLSECITKILQNASVPAYRDEFNSFGLLERGLYNLFVKVASSISASAGQSSLQKQYLYAFHSRITIWTRITCIMLKENPSLCVDFREMQIHHSLYAIADALLVEEQLLLPKAGPPSPFVFSIFVMLATFTGERDPGGADGRKIQKSQESEAVILAGMESDLTKMLELLQRSRGANHKQKFVLDVIKQMLQGRQLFWTAWLNCQAHEMLLSLLSSFQGMDQKPPSDEEYMLLDSILDIICVTLDPMMNDNRLSSEHFAKDVGYGTLASCLVTSGVLATERLPLVLNRVFELITGQAAPRNKIRNPDAVETLFHLLPRMPPEDAAASLKRLLSKIVSNDDITFSKRKQISSLVGVGVFRWIAEPAMIGILQDGSQPTQAALVDLIMELSSEDLSTSHLREFVRVLAKGMPLLLGNQYHPSKVTEELFSAGSNVEEVGLRLLKMTLKGSRVPQVMVGTNVRTRMTSGYVHVVNQADRVWPPSSGYSFSCWLRFPPIPSKRRESSSKSVNSQSEGQSGTICVALCEGRLVIKLDGDDAEIPESYCVLVGAELSMFESSDAARRNSRPQETLTVTAVASNRELEFIIWCHDKQYVARSPSAEDTEMWIRALQQSESITSRTVVKVQATAESALADEVLFIGEANPSQPIDDTDVLEGYVCLVSVYSLESTGCYSRVYFDQANGYLRVDTGSTSTGPSVNSGLKRTSAVFKNVNFDLLRVQASADSDGEDPEANEKAAHWHHIALTHRKSALGNSQVTLFIDGAEVATKKLAYPTSPATGAMQAFLGKDIQICGTFPALPWFLGPTWFTEDILPANAVACIFLLGPSFKGQFSGHAYRSIGDWPEAIATNQLDRATKRRVEVSRAARRAQLNQLSKATRRRWNESAATSSPSNLSAELQLGNAFSELLMKKEDQSDGGGGGSRSSESKKRYQKSVAFSTFVNLECAMSVFGLEVLDVLGSFKLPESEVLFSINTSFANHHQQSSSNQVAQVQFIGTERSQPLNLARVVPSLGGVTQFLLPLVDNSWRSLELTSSLKLLMRCMRRNPSCLAEFLEMKGHAVIAMLLRDRIHLLDDAVLKAAVRLAVSGSIGISRRTSKMMQNEGVPRAYALIVDFAALSQMVLCQSLRRAMSPSHQLQLIMYIRLLIDDENPNAIFNARQLRRANIVVWILIFLGDICSCESAIDEVQCLNLRSCFPRFREGPLNDILDRLLDLLTVFLHLENHVDDVADISEFLLLSMGTRTPFTMPSAPFRVVVLQFLLHEIEHTEAAKGHASTDSDNHRGARESLKSKKEEAHSFAETIVDAVLFRGASSVAVSKKKKDKTDAALAALTSPTSAAAGSGARLGSDSSGDSFESVLMEIIQGGEGGQLGQLEALLSTRILLSLSQNYPAFAHHVLLDREHLHSFKHVLQGYSTDCNFYTPMLAFISNIPIRETKYHDPVLGPESARQFALPTPCGFTSVNSKRCLDQVWELIGSLLQQNCKEETELANRVTVVVLTQLAFQIEVNEAFFATVCHSGFTVLRIITRCLTCVPAPSPAQQAVDHSPETRGPASETMEVLTALMTGRPPHSPRGVRAVAGLDVLKILVTRSLFERDDFAAQGMFLLECIDDEMGKHPAQNPSDGQKCWLALIAHVVKHAKALSDNCSFLVLKNLCTLSVALARYLVDDSKHQGIVEGSGPAESSSASSDGGAGTTATRPSCFGTDILTFFISTVRMCAEPQIAQVVGVDDQQFFYGCFVYCAQTVLLSELVGLHKSNSPSQRLLDCLLNSKHLLIQQTKVSSVIICGNNAHANHIPGEGDTPAASSSAPTSRGGLNTHLNKMKSLTTAAFHKEFGIGAESDRSFLLSLAAELLRWLVDDSERVRYASIAIWQFLFQQRMGVLKELLIVEPKVSLLQNISTSKKEVIDVFHGGFDRLLNISPPRFVSSDNAESRISSGELSVSHESWLQFHIWLTDNYELLKDLIVTRTEPILHHMIDVLLSCQSIRKVNLNAGASRMMGQGDTLSISLDFPRFESESTIAVLDKADEEDFSSSRFAMKKALLKFTNAQESSTEEMQDSMLRWRETTARLQNTRAIWHLGGWNESAHPSPAAMASSSRTASGSRTGSSAAEPFYLERSIFQQNAFRYRLDFTEGPQRMRLRLVRSYAFEAEAASAIAESPSQDKIRGDKSASVEPLQRKLEFHQCVEAFREFMYKRANSPVDDCDVERSAKRDIRILNELSVRSSVDRVKTIVRGILDSEADDCVDLATKLSKAIYTEFLEGGKAQLLNISDLVVAEIQKAVDSAQDDDCGVKIASSFFDVADLEAMQATLNVAGVLSVTRGATEDDATQDSDEDDDDEMTAATSHTPVVLSESEDSDSEAENHERTGSTIAAAAHADSTRTSSSKSQQLVKATKATRPQKPDADEDEKIFDSSLDYIYGGIARFLHREDYPPVRSYNAAYVAGMSKTMGVFLICRNAIYFVGGHGKVFNDSDGSPAAGTGLLTVSANPLSSSPLSPSKPTSTTKKKTKDLIRDTFADIGIAFPSAKGSDSPLYTIVPLAGPKAGGESPTPDANAPIERWCIKYTDVKQFYRIKYQLRPVGIEFFDVFGSTFFLQYESMIEREEIVKLLFQMPIVNSIFWNPVLRSSALSLSVKRIRQALMKRWLKGGISNFEYLMHLNTLAGRSFNDITQYPVFPWVLADYSSAFLDLDNPTTFRDLSKPMGALGENRAALFRERFAAMNYDAGHSPMDSPAFHYGTHYSCSAYVINYLIRMEPFSQLARDLQGGSFDHADRLFRSIPSSWDSASTENLQDVRELVPEFFFLPEFLFNANNYDLGTTQSGEVVSHVKLPAWAHGDPREFIRLHRCALESKYVSENLHQWIDLVFGYKQTGTAALEAQNVFMHFTYEGAVDLDAIDDPVMRNAMLSQIENFGQTPSKLFTSPHPARKVPTLASQGAPSQPSPSTMTTASSVSSSNSNALPTGIGHAYEGNTMGSVEAFVKWHTPLAPALVSIGKDYVFLRKISTGNALEAPVGDVKAVSDKFQCRGVGCTFVPPRFSKYLEWGAGVDGTMKLRVHSSSARHREANKIVGVIEGAHHSRINCAAFSDDGVVLVTGGDDAVVNVLECTKAHGQRLFKQIVKLVGHDDGVTSVAIDRSFNLIVSGSSNGCVIIWDVRTRTFLRELGGHASAVIHVGINNTSGNVMTCTSSELRLWSINGDLLAATTIQAVGLGTITSGLSTNCESWQSGVFAVTGHSNGTIALWGLLFPSDLAKDRQAQAEAMGSTSSSRSVGVSSGALKSAVRVGFGPRQSEGSCSGGFSEVATVLKAIPTCQLVIKKLLVDHRSAITALTLGGDQRQLVSADAEGSCIRWVDDSISTNVI